MFKVEQIEENFSSFQGPNVYGYEENLVDRPEDDQLVEAVSLFARNGATALELVQLIQEGLNDDDTKTMDENLAMRLVYDVCFLTGSNCELEPEEFAEELIDAVDSLWLMAAAGYAYANSNNKSVQNACINEYLGEYTLNSSSRRLEKKALSAVDGNRIQRSVSLKGRRHVRVGSYMWRVRIENGEVFSSKRCLAKWVFKNWGNIKTHAPIIGGVEPFSSEFFNWKWSEHETKNSEEVYSVALSEGSKFTKWYVLHAVAGNIIAKIQSPTDTMWWFKKKGDDGFHIGEHTPNISLKTMAKSGALMKISKRLPPGTQSNSSDDALAFMLNIHGSYTTITKDTGAEQYKANHGVADPDEHNVRPINEESLPAGF